MFPKKKSAKAPFQVALAVPFISLCFSCAHHQPSWTPLSVAPPNSLQEVLERDEAPDPPNTLDPKDSLILNAPSAAEEAIALSLSDAIHETLARNRSIAVQAYLPEISELSIAEARAAFDPTLSISSSYREDNTPGVTTGTTSVSSASTGASGEESGIAETLWALESLAQESQNLLAVMEGDSTTVNHSEGFESSITVSEYLPTGTEVYLSAGYARDKVSSEKEYSGLWTLGVSQSLLRDFGTAVNLVAIRQARNESAATTLAFRDYVLDLVGQVEESYWALALAQETLRIRQFSVDLAQEQLKLNEAMRDVGKLYASALISTEAEVAAQKAQLLHARADLRGRAIDLWQLLNPEAKAPQALEFLDISLPEITALALSVDQSCALALAFRPDLAQARLDLANQELEVVQTKNGLLPNLEAFASYGTKSRGESASDWNKYLDDSTYEQFEVGLNFSMALGNRAEKARFRRSVLQQDQAEAVIKNLEQVIESEIRRAILEVIRQKESLAASRVEVARREEELAVETEQFRLGRSTNLDVLQVQQNLVQARVDAATAQVGYAQALTALYQAEGTLLTRRAVVLEDGKETRS